MARGWLTAGAGAAEDQQGWASVSSQQKDGEK